MVSWISIGKSVFFPIVCSSQLVCITSSGLQGLFISATCKPFFLHADLPSKWPFLFLCIQITQPSILSGLGCTETEPSVIISQISCVLISFPGGSLMIKNDYLEWSVVNVFSKMRRTVKLSATWIFLDLTESLSGLCAAAALAKFTLRPASQRGNLGYPTAPVPGNQLYPTLLSATHT